MNISVCNFCRINKVLLILFLQNDQQPWNTWWHFSLQGRKYSASDTPSNHSVQLLLDEIVLRCHLSLLKDTSPPCLNLNRLPSTVTHPPTLRAQQQQQPSVKDWKMLQFGGGMADCTVTGFLFKFCRGKWPLMNSAMRQSVWIKH